MPSSAFEETFEKVTRLAATFQANEARFLSPEYQEAEARRDFIDKFFIALGWDVRNEAGLPHDQRDVIVERSDKGLHPDYSFRIGGTTKFFVEAKAPCEPLDAAKHILQAKGYAWRSHLARDV